MFRLAAAVLALTIATPAVANWQFTHWGQSLADVLAAPGVMETDDVTRRNHSLSDGGDALATTPYRAGYVETTAIFIFEENKLASVRLLIDPDDRSQVQHALETEYGAPPIVNRVDAVCDFQTQGWQDEEGGNLVEMLDFTCGQEAQLTVMYSPLGERATTGF